MHPHRETLGGDDDQEISSYCCTSPHFGSEFSTLLELSWEMVRLGLQNPNGLRVVVQEEGSRQQEMVVGEDHEVDHKGPQDSH